MTDEDLKLVLAKYQQKAFELFNQNIVLETQVEKLSIEVEKLQKSKRSSKADEEFK